MTYKSRGNIVQYIHNDIYYNTIHTQCPYKSRGPIIHYTHNDI